MQWVSNLRTLLWVCVCWDVLSLETYAPMQHTLTVRFTPWPDSTSLTYTSAVSNQIVACITTVGGCLSVCCSSSVINSAIGWISQNTTVHNCQNNNKKVFIMYILHTFHTKKCKKTCQSDFYPSILDKTKPQSEHLFVMCELCSQASLK